MKGLTDKANEIIQGLQDAFDNPETLVDTLTKASLIPNNSPACHWSYMNRLFLVLADTADARGFNQWKKVKRFVKKGSKAIFILAPRHANRTKVVTDKNGDTVFDSAGKPKTETFKVLIGFTSCPVFKYEDTDGEPIPEYENPTLPKLWSVAEYLGIPVKYTPGDGGILGYYSHDKYIRLHSHNMEVFYHELAHAVHDILGDLRKVKNGVDNEERQKANETVAEISAAVLTSICEGETMGRAAIEYVKRYGATGETVLSLLPEITSVISYILEKADESGVKVS